MKPVPNPKDVEGVLAATGSSKSESLSELEAEMKRLRLERTEAIEGNMAFSFGYNASVDDIQRQMASVQARINVQRERGPKTNSISRTIVTYNSDTNEYQCFAVGDTEVFEIVCNGWNLCIISPATRMATVFANCEIGQETSEGIVAAINGSSLLTPSQVEQLHIVQVEKRKRLEELAEQGREQARLRNEIAKKETQRRNAEVATLRQQKEALARQERRREERRLSEERKQREQPEKQEGGPKAGTPFKLKSTQPKPSDAKAVQSAQSDGSGCAVLIWAIVIIAFLIMVIR